MITLLLRQPEQEGQGHSPGVDGPKAELAPLLLTFVAFAWQILTEQFIFQKKVLLLKDFWKKSYRSLELPLLQEHRGKNGWGDRVLSHHVSREPSKSPELQASFSSLKSCVHSHFLGLSLTVFPVFFFSSLPSLIVDFPPPHLCCRFWSNLW